MSWWRQSKKKSFNISVIISEKLIFSDFKAQENTDQTIWQENGWFERFQFRSNIRSISLREKQQTLTEQPRQLFLKNFKNSGISCPADLFTIIHNYSRTFISRDFRERSTTGFIADLGTRWEGSLQLKSMVVYHSQDLQAFKGLDRSYLRLKLRGTLNRSVSIETTLVLWQRNQLSK